MTVTLSRQDLLLALTADTVMQARISCDQLYDVIIPSISPQRRKLAEAVKQRLQQGELLTEPFLNDLENLIDFVRSEIEKGIHTIWIADEHNVHGGHYERKFDTRAYSLAVAVGHLVRLYEAAVVVIDFAEAERLVDDFF